MALRVEHLSQRTREQECQVWKQCERGLDSDTSEAAKAHLTA